MATLSRLPTSQTAAVAGRVLRQIRHDRRFLALSLVVPVLIICMVWVFFEAVDNPFFDTGTFIPPVSAFIVHFLTYVLSVIVLVRERTQGTLARMFVSGYGRRPVIAGYVLAYTVLATVQAGLVLVETNLLFDLGYPTGTWLRLYAVFWGLAVTSIALGIFVSNFGRNEGQVIPFIPLMLMPSVFFSGMIVAVDQLPAWISWLHVITPMYYATEAIKGSIAGDGLLELVWLAVYGAVVLALAVLMLREGE